LTESWLDADIRLCEVSIPHYLLLRRDRTRHGGGIMLYVHESLRVVSYKSDLDLELLSAVLYTNSGSLWFGIYYSPPNSSLLDNLEETLSDLDLVTHRHAILVGNFNVNLLQADDTSCLDLLGIASSFGLTQVVDSPTRVTSISSTLIDHVYVSLPSLVNSLHVIPPLESSDHNCIEFIVTLSRARVQHCKCRVWLYKRANFEEMNRYLETELNDPCDFGEDVNALWYHLKKKIACATRLFIPSKVVACRRSVPWLTVKVKRLMHLRDKAHRVAKEQDCPRLWEVDCLCLSLSPSLAFPPRHLSPAFASLYLSLSFQFLPLVKVLTTL